MTAPKTTAKALPDTTIIRTSMQYPLAPFSDRRTIDAKELPAILAKP